jgi:hypothetical protein
MLSLFYEENYAASFYLNIFNSVGQNDVYELDIYLFFDFYDIDS